MFQLLLRCAILLAMLSSVIGIGLTAGAIRVTAIEQRTTDPVGRQGIPSGWTGESFGRRANYDFTIEEHGGRRALHLWSRNEHSTGAIFGGERPRTSPPRSISCGRGLRPGFALGSSGMSGTQTRPPSPSCGARRPAR